MQSRFEIDYRWAAVFLSLLISFVLRHYPTALTAHMIVVAALTLAYFLVLPKYLNTLEGRFRVQLMSYLEQDAYERAVELIDSQRLLRGLGRGYVTQNTFGLIKARQGDYSKARDAFERARKKAPYGERAAIDLNLVNADVALGESSVAIERCRSILAERPNSPLIQEKLADLLLAELDDEVEVVGSLV